MRPAVFLDRDGTIIEQVHYLRDPAEVRLIPGAAGAIRGLREAGYACVVVSNQSAVGRGLMTAERLGEVHEEMCRQLRESGAELDGSYYCPAVPASGDRRAVDHPDRKPAPGMLRRASGELGLDLSRSWMVGDMISDLLAGRAAGCRATVLVRSGHGTDADASDPAIDHVAADLAAAADLILGTTPTGSD